MGIGKFLTETQPKAYNPKDTTEVVEAWKTLYKSKLSLNYRVDVAERTCVKRLVVEYGKEDVIKTLTYYIENYERITYIDGYPSIKALVGFRRTLFPEALNGTKAKVIKGQATAQTLSDEHLWESKKTKKEDDSNGNSKKSSW